MQRGIEETTRRRKLQEAYNKAHGITPKGIQKAIADTRLAGGRKDIEEEVDERDTTKMDKDELRFYTLELEEQMDMAAKNLEFELAAKLRDKLTEIKKIKKLAGKR